MTSGNNLKIESVDINDIVLDSRNARKHDTKNLNAIKGSLAKFGQQKPIVIDKRSIVIAGNGTVEAARSLGWKTIDVVRTDLEGAEAVAFALADNRTAELAEWDDDILKQSLIDLNNMDFDIGEIGFDLSMVGLDHDLDDLDEEDKGKKYILEIEFPDEQAQLDEYEKLLSLGLIVRIK